MSGRHRRRRHRRSPPSRWPWRPGRRCSKPPSLANHAAGVVVVEVRSRDGDARRAVAATLHSDQRSEASRHAPDGAPKALEPSAVCQCLKCRRPVNTIASPCSSAAAIDFRVAHRSAWLHDRRRARARRPHRVRRGTERTRLTPRPIRRASDARAAPAFSDRDVHGVDTAHLTGADRAASAAHR